MRKKVSLTGALFVLMCVVSFQVAAACTSSSITFPAPFLGNNDEVFQLSNGDLWQVKFEYNYFYAYYPSVEICTSSNKLVIRNKELNVQKLANKSDLLVDGYVSGTWQGWRGDSIVSLTNGQQWKQSSYEYSVNIKALAKAFVYQSFGTYRMVIEGEKPVTVVPHNFTPSSGGSGTLPAPLSGLSASDGTNAFYILLEWNASSGATSYDVYFALSQDGERTFLTSTTDTALTVRNTTAEVTYYFFVFPSNSSGVNTGMVDSGYMALAANLPPLISIVGEDRTIGDSDGKSGELVSFEGVALTIEGVILDDVEWIVDGVVVATESRATFSLPDGESVVTFKGTNGIGVSSTTSVTVTVVPPVATNKAPVVSIAPTELLLSDSDSLPGETISLSGSAVDEDGSIASANWLINGAAVATGTSATLSLSDGETTVTFRATDNLGLSSEATINLVVAAPVANVAPVAEILTTSQRYDDTDGKNGETINLMATASDSDGSIASVEWSIGGLVVSRELSATLFAPNGLNKFDFKAFDNDGLSSTTSIIVEVVAPKPVYEPTDEWPTPFNGVPLPSTYSLEMNNLGYLSAEDGYIYSCVRLMPGGPSSLIDGASEYDIVFAITSASEGLLSIVKLREFNLTNTLTDSGESPSCSGYFDLSQNIYEDTILIGESLFTVSLELVDPQKFEFRLINFSQLPKN